MITAQQCYSKFGDPASKAMWSKWLVMWDVPAELEIGVIPKRVYCHKLLIAPLSQAFRNLIDRGYVKELKTWDGCYFFRPVRGYEKKYQAAVKVGNTALAISYLSIHSWATAVDVNASWNQIGQVPKLSKGFVKCFTDAGFNWGGNFKNRLDGMHFELANI